MTRRFLACSLTLLASSPLWAQPSAQVVPLTGEINIAVGKTTSHHLAAPDVAVLGQREFLVTWDLGYQRYSGSQLVDWGSAISGRKITLQGQPAGEELILEPFERRSYQGFHRLAADAAGRFAVLWQERDTSDLLLRLFAPDGSRLETTRLEPDPGFVEYPYLHAVAMDPSGRISASWTRSEERHQPPSELWLQLFDATAEPVREAFQVRSPGIAGQPSLAMAKGNTILVYYAPAGNSATLAVQRFHAAGRPLGRPVPVVGGTSIQRNPAVAATAEGRFVVVWADTQGIGARLFDAAGRKVGPVIRVTTTRFADFPDVALDALGNFVVIWQSGPSSDGPFVLGARLFNRDGVPQGGEAVVDPEFPSQYFPQVPPSVALSDAGTFLVAWGSDSVLSPEAFHPGIQGRTYAVQRDDDRCVFRDGTFLCDTARDGDLTHLRLLFGESGDRPLLADFDGDGDDDFCVHRGNSFLCDTAGEGTIVVLRFGNAAHTPLAGDLDGDGDDDPCVRRGRSFACDLFHNGGAPEYRRPLGRGSDDPALGDVDGDGDDDPCVWRPSTGTFLCDANHNGEPDLFHAVDAQPGDHPLLGDVDGDGDDDFCFARDEELLCDLDRDGVLTEETLATEPGDVLVLGNVDGV
jgi:hypothetical protein